MIPLHQTGDLLSRLEAWYIGQCDGSWEHSYGVKIGTLDNPGWTLQVDLTDTKWDDASIQAVRIERSEHNWVHCWVQDNQFHAAGGPLNLREMIATFLDFVGAETPGA